MQVKKSSDIKLVAAIFFMILVWGSAYVGIRAGLKDYSPGSLALFRYIIASLMMFLIHVKTLRFRKIHWQDLLNIFILGIFGFAIYSVALNYGEQTVTAGTASFLISQIPVVITLFAVIFQNEKFAWFGWLGTIISIFGIFLITIGEKKAMHFDAGIIYMFIAVLSGSIYAALQKLLLKRIHPIEFTAYAIWGGTIALLIYFPQLLHELPQANLNATLSVVYLGIFPAAIGYLLWSYIVSMMPVAKAASYLYIIPFATIIIGWIWLQEIPTDIAMVGGILALSGAYLVNKAAKKIHNPAKKTGNLLITK